MPEIKNIPAFAVCLSGLMLAIRPDSPNQAVAFIGAAFLFGFEMWIDRKNDSEVADLANQVKQLKERVDGLMLKQGLGR